MRFSLQVLAASVLLTSTRGEAFVVVAPPTLASNGLTTTTTTASPPRQSPQRQVQLQQQQRQRRQRRQQQGHARVSLSMMPLPDFWEAATNAMTTTWTSFALAMDNDGSSTQGLAAAAAGSGDFFDGAIFRSLSTIARQGGLPAMALAVAISDSVPLLPTQPISIATGALFGLQGGLPAVMLGQALATLFAISAGRQVADSPRVQDALDNMDDKVRKVLDNLTSGLNSDDWKQVFGTIVVVRQSPVVPFSLGNYFVGAATSAPILPAVAATIVGCFPLNCVFVGAGAGGRAAIAAALNGDLPLARPLEVAGAAVTALLVGSFVKAIYDAYQTEEVA